MWLFLHNIHTCIHVHMHTHTHTYIHVHAHTHAHTCTQCHAHAHIHTYVYLPTCTHIHMYTQFIMLTIDDMNSERIYSSSCRGECLNVTTLHLASSKHMKWGRVAQNHSSNKRWISRLVAVVSRPELIIHLNLPII